MFCFGKCVVFVREALGVWSVLGIPYIPRGAPDLTLVHQAQQKREERKLQTLSKTFSYLFFCETKNILTSMIHHYFVF